MRRREQPAPREQGLRTQPTGKQSKGRILYRLWKYMGRSRLLLVLALGAVLHGSLLSLYGPKLSGQAINAIDLGEGRVDFSVVWRCALLMAACYVLSALFTFLLNVVMVRLSRRVARQMRHDIFENLAALPVGFFDRYQTRRHHQRGDLRRGHGEPVPLRGPAADPPERGDGGDVLCDDADHRAGAGDHLRGDGARHGGVHQVAGGEGAAHVPPPQCPAGRPQRLVEEMLSGQKTTRAYGREAAVLEKFDEKNQVAVDAYTVAEAYGTITGPLGELYQQCIPDGGGACSGPCCSSRERCGWGISPALSSTPGNSPALSTRWPHHLRAPERLRRGGAGCCPSSTPSPRPRTPRMPGSWGR